MSTPAKSFEDLRSILGKLDRKIDSARSRRLGLDEEPVREPIADDGPLIGKAETAEVVEAPVSDDAGDASDAAARRRSPYGRAKPLNRGTPGSGWVGG